MDETGTEGGREGGRQTDRQETNDVTPIPHNPVVSLRSQALLSKAKQRKEFVSSKERRHS